MATKPCELDRFIDTRCNMSFMLPVHGFHLVSNYTRRYLHQGKD